VDNSKQRFLQENAAETVDIVGKINGLQENNKSGQGKWEGKQNSDNKRITASKARQKEALHCAQI
jgi:hypothetical protein